jgi:HemY protein
VHLQKKLQDFWASLPRFLQKETNIQTHYAEALAQSGADDDAAELIRALLDSAWNNTAIALYGRIRSTQPDRAFANALRWKAEHPHNPALLLTLGRLSLQTHQWKAARDYLETSLSLQQNTEARAELLRLLLVSDPEAAAQLQTELLNAQLPNLPLPARP